MSSPSSVLRRLALAASLLAAVLVAAVAAMAVAAGPSAAQGPSSSSSSIPSSSSTSRPSTTTTFRPTSTTFRPSTTASTRPPSTTTTTRRPVSTTSTVVTTTTTDPDEGFSATTVARPTTTAPTTTVPTTTAPATTETSEVSGEGGGLRLVVGGLVGVAALISGLTFLYWRHTRPMADELVPYGDPIEPTLADDATDAETASGAGATGGTGAGASGGTGAAGAALATSVAAAPPTDASATSASTGEASATAASSTAGLVSDPEVTVATGAAAGAGAALVAGGLVAASGSLTEAGSPEAAGGANALVGDDGGEGAAGEADGAGESFAAGLDPDARTALSPLVVAPLPESTADAPDPDQSSAASRFDQPPASGTPGPEPVADEPVGPTDVAGPVLFDQEVARTAEVPVVPVAGPGEAGINAVLVDDAVDEPDIAPGPVEPGANEPIAALDTIEPPLGAEPRPDTGCAPDADAAGVDEAGVHETDADSSAAGVDGADADAHGAVVDETEAADGDLDRLPPPPMIPKARPRIEPSGVTILGPVRSREPSTADDDYSALDPDAPMRIVTIEDIERDRRFDEGGTSSGSDEPEGRS